MSRKSKQTQRAAAAEQKKQQAANQYSGFIPPVVNKRRKRERATETVNKLEDKQSKLNQRIAICDGLVIGSNTIKSNSQTNVSNLNSVKTKLSRQLEQAQSDNKTGKAAILQARLSKIDSQINNNTGFINVAESQKQRIETKKDNLSGIVTQVAVLKQEVGTQAAELFKKEQELARRLLKAQDKFDRENTKEQFAKLAVDASDCICPQVFDPVVIDGVTYSNSCIAACKGKTVPINPTPPTTPPSIGNKDRICLQVIICGSDGNDYNNSCLPNGVFARVYGKSCSEINFTLANPNPSIVSQRPLAQIVKNDNLLNIVGSGNTIPQKICGSNNITYNSINNLPNGVSIKHFGSCRAIV
jgi:hypothetical protein